MRPPPSSNLALILRARPGPSSERCRDPSRSSYDAAFKVRSNRLGPPRRSTLQARTELSVRASFAPVALLRQRSAPVLSGILLAAPPCDEKHRIPLPKRDSA